MPALSEKVAQPVIVFKMRISWIKYFKQEFTTEKCYLKPREPQFILQSQWKLHPITWLFYRMFMATYSLIWCICCVVQTNNLKWFIFLTHLTYTILTIYFNLALVNFICYQMVRRKKGTPNIKDASLAEISVSNPTTEINVETPSATGEEILKPPSFLQLSLSIQWHLHNLTCVISLYVTIAFWCIDYVPGGPAPDSININMHAVNSLLVLLELGMTAAPIHLVHFVHVLIYCLTYIFFTIIYWAAGGTNIKGKRFIYSSLDYGRNPIVAIGCIIGSICIIMPLLQFLVWNLYLFKRHIFSRFVGKNSDVLHC
ncbi:protein rolling stone isoform X2 [Narcine bancroftii]|uniref:protein rolling stone isoform X2 n=1 Tax=Narcine bancroftii TaxID=1343680 RepID=UPI0038319654